MDLKKIFTEIFGETAGGNDAIRVFYAPGRVNIIGEHTDYNGGLVLPCAINMGTYALIRLRDDASVADNGEPRFASTNSVPNAWEIYPRGIVHHMQRALSRRADSPCLATDAHHGFEGTCGNLHVSPAFGFEGTCGNLHVPPAFGFEGMRGNPHVFPAHFDMLFSGNIPNGSGLSSSASIEMATAVALNETFALGFEMLELVKIARESENEFCGVNCGIMDMFAIGTGKRGFATLLNCADMQFEYVPMRLGDFQLIILDTKKRRSLNESRYNERRAECEAGHPARMRHVKTENERVVAAANALRAGDVAALGRLLVESHNSLRDDFEVSCFELDALVEAAIKNPSCVGARMTGAGFGGCAIALVERAKVAQFSAAVTEEYEKSVGYAPDIYPTESADGAGAVNSL